MPRISDQFLDCVVYLYPTQDDARAGEAIGGTGFLVAVPFPQVEGRSSAYAITNSHVVREGNSPIVRLNTQDGKTDVLPLDQTAWIHHPDGDDIAVAPIGLSSDFHQFRTIPSSMFMTQDTLAEQDIGPGDDVFFVGRFITHEGRQRNLPSVRFGNISMMPREPIRHPTRGINQESFLVEMRSLPGYSGSPVLVHILPFTSRPGRTTYSRSRGPFLLGIDWVHLADFRPILESDKETPIRETWYVEQNSGMAGVIPAWKIAEVLEMDVLVQQRHEADKRWRERQ